ncbi:MAG: hypothetical protein JW951_02940 [Lentisphaerae bacterium]|nr:hypothetical protein [Lentisphaerota bacterium]
MTHTAKRKPTYRCHVLCSTHWDREWLKTEIENRFLLVELFDNLLELFARDPEARTYHLDAQSIPIEDYVAVRPERRETLRGHVSAGRLLIGPWYTLPEMNVTDGECTVRNLLYGHRVGERFGHVMKVGFTPTSWGQLSQLPQIYREFGIDTAIFYRGINQELTPAEYLWEAPDGTRIVGIRPSSQYSRANLWAWVYLPAVHDIVYWDPSQTPYWSGNGQACRLAHSGESAYRELHPPDRYRPERIAEGMRKLLDDYRDITTTNVIPAFLGHDQSFPTPEAPRLIADINARCEDVEMIYSTFEQYAGEVAAIVRGREDNVVVRGEMRYTNRSAPRNCGHLLPDIISCRAKLKQENRRNELALLRGAEPVAAMQWMLGQEVPRILLDAAWRGLLANHSHDSIGGCCIDGVIDEVLHRGRQSRYIGEGIVRHGLPAVAARIDSGGAASDAILLTVFNLLPYARSQVVRCEVDVPAERDRGGLEIFGPDGETVLLQVVRKENARADVDTGGIRYGFDAVRYTIDACFEQVPALGYVTCEARPAADRSADGAPIGGERTLENAHLKVGVNANGTLRVEDKRDGAVYDGLNAFEDEGEAGNAWVRKRPAEDRRVDSLGAAAEVALVANGPVRAALEVRVTLDLPVAATDDFEGRRPESRPVTLVSEVSLCRGAARVDICTRLDNTVRDHRLRALFPTGIACASYQASVPFDVVTRPVPKPSSPDWTEPVQQTDPTSGMVDVSDGRRGLAVLNQGLYEAEVKDDDARTIALTLLRCSWQHRLWNTDRWPDTGFQNPGAHALRYAVLPHAGDWRRAGAHDQLDDMDSPLVVLQSGRNPDGALPPRMSFLEIAPAGVRVSAIKPPEKGEGVVVRLYNPGPDDLTARLRTREPVSEARLLTLEEKDRGALPMVDHAVEVPVAHHKIVTVLLRRGRASG